MTDTVRAVDELVSLLFADGQFPGSITEQDVRDAIVSISLETVDLSGLPRTAGGLNQGRLWVDANKILRVVTQQSPLQIVTFVGNLSGAGGLSADARKSGAQQLSASARLAGSAVLSPSEFSPEFSSEFLSGIQTTLIRGSVLFSGNGAGFLRATTVTRLAARAVFAGLSGFIGTANATALGPFSPDFSSDFYILNTLGPFTFQFANATFSSAGSLRATASVVSGQQWGVVNASITKSNSNLTIAKTSSDGVQANATPTQFKASGKWYWEVHIDAFTNLALGIGNPSVSTADGSGLGDTNSFQYYTFQGAGGVSANGTFVTSPDPFNSAGTIVSFALDMDNGSWWPRVNGGTWTGNNGGAGDPATNTNPIPTSLITTTGGLGPMASLVGLGEGVSLKIGSSTFSVPVGFTQM